MKVTLLFLLAVAAVSALGKKSDKLVADQEFLTRQKDLLRLFIRPAQYNLYKDQADIGKNFKLEENYDKYSNPEAVKKFVQSFKNGVMPCKEIFSEFQPEYLDEAIQLYNVFYFAKDFDTFYKSACWARDVINEGQFIYALSIAITQREDCKFFKLPPIYEVYPYRFIKSDAIQKAYEIRMQGEYYKPITHAADEVFKVDQTYYVPTNYTGWWYKRSPEHSMTYFTEDVGLNAFNTYWNYYYPSFFNSTLYKYEFDRRGELFYYYQQQLAARYQLERLSNALPEVAPFNFFSEKPTVGYEPSLRYQNGKQFPNRPEGAKINPYKLEEYAKFEKRIVDAIEGDYVFTKDKKKLSFYTKEGINYLGEMIAGTTQSPNKNFYGALYQLIRGAFGHVTDAGYQFSVAPSALEQFQTVLRDPAYYTLYKRIDQLFKKYKSFSPKYSYEDLAFPGVKVDSVKFAEKLITYFDNFDVALDNAVDVGKQEEIEKVDIRARQMRLNHKPYNFNIKVTSDKDTTGYVRVFLGPKDDYLGNEYSLEKMRQYMVEMDRFPYKFTTGVNNIERTSGQSTVAVSDKPTYRELFSKVNKALAGEDTYYIDEYERSCGFPQRLLLPRGTPEGMRFRFFVMVTPFDEKYASDPKLFDYSSVPYCGVGRFGNYPDNKPMGFPFDRVIEDTDYFYKNPNMQFEDVTIFHKDFENSPRH